MAAAPVDAAGIVARMEPGLSAPASTPEDANAVPQAGQPDLRLLARVGVVDPTSLDDYRAHGGFRALERARAIGPEQVIDEVTRSGLLGRGGAAFPTGRKWAAVAAQQAQPHYLVCNADESEPGTFKDRVLMEGDPFAVVEAMAIEAFAVGAGKAYLYIRGEYPLAEARIANAITAATEAGLLDGLDIELRRGAGAYICGEETALFESIEGKRGEPRNKPPFPVEVGLFDKPTAVNNVETIVNVLLIVGEDGGAEAFKAIGTEGSTGPKLFCLSGNVERPGTYEVPFGTTLGELLALGGGVPGGREIKAILLGGAAGVFVGPEALDLPLTFEATRAAGATLGSGVVMVFDERADLVGTLTRIAQFFRDESCGQCVPCRVGTVRQEELLARLAAGSGVRSRDDELVLLREVGQAMRDAVDLRARPDRVLGDRIGVPPARAGGPVSDDLQRTAAPRFPVAAVTQVSPIVLEPPARPTRIPQPPPVEAPPQVELTIDGVAVTVPKGSTILDACRALAVDTPTLCYADNLTPVNVCRVCVVEVTGSRVLVPSCSRKAEPGMEVFTDSERVRTSRKVVLELLGSSVDLSLAGPAVPDGSLADWSQRYGADPSRFGPPAEPAAAGERDAHEPGHHHAPHGDAETATVAQPVKVDNDLYVRDYSKCVLCYKCVEACGEDAQNTFAIAVAGRGFDARISTEYATPLPTSACVYCGNCIGACPTGALMFKSEHDMRAEGTWDESAQTVTNTICPYCGVGCSLDLHVQDEEIVKVTSPLDSSVTEGHLCIKGRFGFQFVNERPGRNG